MKYRLRTLHQLAFAGLLANGFIGLSLAEPDFTLGGSHARENRYTALLFSSCC